MVLIHSRTMEVSLAHPRRQNETAWASSLSYEDHFKHPVLFTCLLPSLFSSRMLLSAIWRVVEASSRRENTVSCNIVLTQTRVQIPQSVRAVSFLCWLIVLVLLQALKMTRSSNYGLDCQGFLNNQFSVCACLHHIVFSETWKTCILILPPGELQKKGDSATFKRLTPVCDSCRLLMRMQPQLSDI